MRREHFRRTKEAWREFRPRLEGTIGGIALVGIGDYVQYANTPTEIVFQAVLANVTTAGSNIIYEALKRERTNPNKRSNRLSNILAFGGAAAALTAVPPSNFIEASAGVVAASVVAARSKRLQKILE